MNRRLLKNVAYLILVILIIFNICYLFAINFHKKVSNEGSIINNEVKYLNRSSQIKDTFLYLENWKDTIALSDLIKNGNYLILRIPLVYCQDCKFSELENLRVFSEQYCLRNICAIINVNTPRDLKELTLSFDFKFLKLGSMKMNVLDISEEKFNSPFYFILDTNLRASMFFFPDTENKSLTIDYIRKMKAQYLE